MGVMPQMAKIKKIQQRKSRQAGQRDQTLVEFLFPELVLWP